MKGRNWAQKSPFQQAFSESTPLFRSFRHANLSAVPNPSHKSRTVWLSTRSSSPGLGSNNTAQPLAFTSKYHLLEAQEKAFTDKEHVLASGLSAWHMSKEKNESAWQRLEMQVPGWKRELPKGGICMFKKKKERERKERDAHLHENTGQKQSYTCKTHISFPGAISRLYLHFRL